MEEEVRGCNKEKVIEVGKRNSHDPCRDVSRDVAAVAHNCQSFDNDSALTNRSLYYYRVSWMGLYNQRNAMVWGNQLSSCLAV